MNTTQTLNMMNTDENTLRNDTTAQAKTASTAPRRPIEVEVNEMIKLMHDLSLVLEQENELLHKAKFRQAENLQQDKRTYVDTYKSKIAALFERKDEFAALDETLAERLVVTRTSFLELLNKNLRILSNAKESSRRLVQRILDTARNTVESKPNYNAGGAMLASNPQSATSVRFNQEL